MRVLAWLLRLVVFVLLFGLALNNQHLVGLKFYFGQEWRTPMIFVVLAAFVLGCAAGVAAMLPSWWRRRNTATAIGRADATRNAQRAPVSGAALAPAGATHARLDELVQDHPPRDGL